MKLTAIILGFALVGASGYKIIGSSRFTTKMNIDISSKKVDARSKLLSAPMQMGIIDRIKNMRRTNRIPKLTQSPPRKIGLFIEPTPFTHVSGYSNRFKEMLKYLAKAGDEVHILTADDVKDAPDQFEGFPINYTKGFRFPLYNQIVLSLDHEGKGKEMLTRIQPDLLHVTAPGFITFCALIYARLFRLPLVFSYHTHLPHYAIDYLGWIPGIDEFAWKMLRIVLNRADLNLVTSSQMRDELESHGIQRIQVWRKGIDTDVFNPAYKSDEMRNRLSDGHPEDPLIIYIGRLGAEKNLKLLKPIMEKIPNARLAFVGKGPEMENLQEHFKGTKTVFTGLMSGEELSQAFASADVFVMPSESETLGFVVLESMASGVPVVAAKAGGIPDLIQDEVDSYLVEPGNADAFVSRIKQLIEDPEHCRTMSAAARAEAEKWDWESATSVLRNEQYKQAISNFRWRAFKGFGLPRTRSKMRAFKAQLGSLIVRLKRAQIAQKIRQNPAISYIIRKSPLLQRIIQVRVGKFNRQRVLVSDLVSEKEEELVRLESKYSKY
mmetsp:Transcript_6017/g.7821  ORF Transcript_6017/g.7821 Transcript_6017/m.7821 type:complete len:550 (-) Transcript_6017:248-1897(-)